VLKCEFAAFDPGVIEDAVQQIEQTGAGAVDGIDIPALFGVKWGIPENVGEA
jgi:hypothetical protein